MMIPGKDFVGLGVGAVIVRDHRILMLLRTSACRNNEGPWTILGGMVEPYESLEDAVRRETAEEVGLAVASEKLIGVSDRIFDKQHWVSILYYCETTGAPHNLEPLKHLKMEWHDLDSLPDNITSPSRDGIAAYKRTVLAGKPFAILHE